MNPPAQLLAWLPAFRLPACPQPNHMPADPTPFQQLHRHLEQSFPLVYSSLQHERINEYSILFTWKGTNPALRPLL